MAEDHCTAQLDLGMITGHVGSFVGAHTHSLCPQALSGFHACFAAGYGYRSCTCTCILDPHPLTPSHPHTLTAAGLSPPPLPYQLSHLPADQSRAAEEGSCSHHHTLTPSHPHTITPSHTHIHLHTNIQHNNKHCRKLHTQCINNLIFIN